MTEQLDKNAISSAHINFLFGAGVNGGAFPQIDGFKETTKLLSDLLGRETKNFEEDLNTLPERNDIQKIYKNFKKEFNDFENNLDYSHQSLINLKELFQAIYKIVEKTENRQRDMKQINVYTLNYDNVPERILDSLGYMNNSVSASNLGENIKFLDLVAYDYSTYKYMPTFMISKLHGDIENPIFPGTDKYKTSLAPNYFEINFRMKEQLCKMNSVLFVIGYSCGDEHINKIILDCIKHGLLVYWFKYCKDDRVLDVNSKNQLVVFEQEDYSNPKDTTLICKQELEKINE